jgi:hypothetical protein
MALHRDIYWVGKQWAVTGYGIQACDQKQKGKFDIESSHIWEDGVLDNVRDQKWLNIGDFENAVEAARKRYPEPPRKVAPPPEPPKSEAPEPERSQLVPAKAEPVRTAEPMKTPRLVAIEPPEPAPPSFELRVNGARAKLLSVWRVRVRR